MPEEEKYRYFLMACYFKILKGIDVNIATIDKMWITQYINIVNKEYKHIINIHCKYTYIIADVDKHDSWIIVGWIFLQSISWEAKGSNYMS